LILALVISARCGSPSSPNALVGSVSRGSVNLPLADTAGSNVASSHIPANEITVSFRDATTSTVVLYVAGFEDQGGGSYLKHWDLTIGLDGDPASGTVYQLGGNQLSAPGDATIVYQDDAGDWMAGGGTITVTAVVGAKVDFTLDAVTMVARPAGLPGTVYPMGTFTLSGTLTIDNIDDVCDCIG
jgi:hypothetical protein